jgi:hypothetical protein
MSENQIFLDESTENIPPEGFTVVKTEVEFLRSDGSKNLWISGQVCNYARVVYQARGIKVTEVISPRARLRLLLGNTADTVPSSVLSRSLEILDSAKPKTLAELLFHLTRDEFWIQDVSLEHAARFLTIELDGNLVDLAERQRQIWLTGTGKSELTKVYQNAFTERENFLHDWLTDKSTRKRMGEFPLRLPEKTAVALGDDVARRLRENADQAIIDFPKQTVNKDVYAKAIVEYFSVNVMRLTADIIARVSALLTSAQRVRLEQLLLPPDIGPVAIDADFQTALKWAVEKYLPFRASRWDTESCAEADAMAESFADWLLENYPKLTNLDRETSPINLRAFYTVKKLLKQGYWVLWTVVDGLNYENHQKLLQMLGEKSTKLRVAENSPVFAVLPTITEKAKYGLTTGKFPSENTNRNWDVKNNFRTLFPTGVYAGSDGKNKLLEGLKQDEPTVCYWNFLELDECYHNSINRVFLRNDINAVLDKLARNINQLVSMAKNMNRVAVVICSDHGQMINDCRRVEIDLTDKHAHGRTALASLNDAFLFANASFVKTNNGETVELNPTSFRLSEPTTIALGSTYFVDLKATEHQGAIGVHGGLFPEEAVIGLAVLMREPSHKKISASANGSGESGKRGTIKLGIDNPNPAPVNPLILTIEGIEIAEQGELLLAKVPALSKLDFDMVIEKFPAASDGEEFVINGVLHYEFDDGTTDQCPVSGKLTCKSLYTSKNPSLLDRFKK